MTERNVVLDTWAWFEILRGTRKGQALRRRYLDDPKARVHTSAISIGEIAARLAGEGKAALVEDTTARIRAGSTIQDIDAELAQAAGLLREELRATDSGASLADGIVLAGARRLRGRLISSDPAFRKQADVSAF